MKVKLKKVVCLLCSLVFMLMVLIIPVSASDVSEPLFVMQDGTKVCNINDLEMFNNVTESMFIDQLNASLGYDINNYYYYINVSLYSNRDRFVADIGIFEKDNGLIDNILFIDNTTIQKDSYNSVKYSAQSTFFIRSDGLEYRPSNNNLSFRSQYAYDGCIGLITNIPNISYNGENVKEEEKPVVPFTVSYSPELSDDMKNVVYIPSKGGANGVENGLVEQDNDTLSATVTLTDDYKKIMSENDLGTDFSQSSYSVIGCISTEPITENTNMTSFFNDKVVLYSFSTNTYKHSGLPTASGGYTNRASTVDYGVSPIYTIPRDRPLVLAFVTSAIDYESHNITHDDTLYVNIIGINATHYTNKTSEITYTSASTDDFLELTNPFEIRTLMAVADDSSNVDDSSEDDRGFSSHTSPHGSSGTVNNNKTDIHYYYSYCVSNDFKYTRYSDYEPITLTDSDGKTYNPSTSSLSDMLNIKPLKRTDNEDISNGNKGGKLEDTMLDPDDYATNLNNKTLAKNYQSFEFDATDLKSIFTEGSDFFKFLTTSISILPSYFMTILISFFTVFLAIVLIKFVF